MVSGALSNAHSGFLCSSDKFVTRDAAANHDGLPPPQGGRERIRCLASDRPKRPHSFRSYRYDFDTICQPSASFIATR